jgi:hypothetical protein
MVDPLKHKDILTNLIEYPSQSLLHLFQLFIPLLHHLLRFFKLFCCVQRIPTDLFNFLFEHFKKVQVGEGERVRGRVRGRGLHGDIVDFCDLVFGLFSDELGQAGAAVWALRDELAELLELQGEGGGCGG